MKQSCVKIKFHFIMVKASHHNTYVSIKSVKSYSNHYLVGLQTFTTGGGMHGLFSLFAGLERILRRFSVFAEEPLNRAVQDSRRLSHDPPTSIQHSVNLI